MRVIKFVQFATGLAVAGGAFVLLSSSALAADSGSATVPQGTNALPTTQSDQVQHAPTFDQPSLTAPGNPVQSVTQDTSSQTKSQDNTTTTTETGGGSTPTQGSDQGGPGTGLNNSAPATASQTNSGAPAASQADTTGTGGSGSVVTNDNKPVQQGVQQSLPLATGVAANTQQTSAKSSSMAVPVIYFQSRVLAVQSMIVNHESEPSDLASTIPSAPVPAKAPAPTKSNGALGQITAELAAITVPQPFVPNLVPSDRTILALSLITLVVLFGNLVFMTYGLWLRRGGFATAARSDSPVAGFTSLFATPLLLGYASAPPRSHSPSLMVSDYKIRKILFPMLAERRRSI